MEIRSLDTNGIKRILQDLGSPFEDLEEEEPSVFRNLLEYTARHLGCATVAIERQYICRDYRSEFSEFYSKCFDPIQSLATRLHFFRATLQNDSVIATAKLRSLGYCGYAVIRPTRTNKVGRTTLKPAVWNRNRDYYITVAKDKIHMYGREFEVVGAPYLQQDSMLMCCAHAAIWNCVRYLHLAYNYPAFLPHEITKAACQSYTIGSRVKPTEGLSEYDIMNCFLNLGYSPVLFAKPKRESYWSDEAFDEARARWNPVRQIYRYVESGFPVVAMVPGHAMTVVGHTHFGGRWKGSLEGGPFEGLNVVFSDRLVDGLVHHDDTVGPYRLLPALEADAVRFRRQKRKDLLPPKTRRYGTAQDDVVCYAVPLPEKVYILAEHLDDILGNLLRNPITISIHIKMRTEALGGNELAGEYLDSAFNTPLNPLVLRPYVVASADYKRMLHGLPANTMPQTVRHVLLRLPMPRFIWVVDVTTMKRICEKSHSDRTVMGQILLDATGNKMAMPYLAIHLPGQLAIPQTDALALKELIPIADDYPSPLIERRHLMQY